jgi:hypothetical protein
MSKYWPGTWKARLRCSSKCYHDDRRESDTAKFDYDIADTDKVVIDRLLAGIQVESATRGEYIAAIKVMSEWGYSQALIGQRLHVNPSKVRYYQRKCGFKPMGAICLPNTPHSPRTYGKNHVLKGEGKWSL